MVGPETPFRRHSRYIRDARGRKVSQLDPVAIYLLRQYSIIDAGVLRSITNERGVRITRGERASLAVGVIGVAVVLGLFMQSIIAGDFGSAPIARTSSLLMFCFFAWFYWARAKHARFDNVAAAMLRHRRCPHCAYDLRFLPADPADGATVCPECGGAWMLGDEARDRPSRAFQEPGNPSHP